MRKCIHSSLFRAQTEHTIEGRPRPIKHLPPSIFGPTLSTTFSLLLARERNYTATAVHRHQMNNQFFSIECLPRKTPPWFNTFDTQHKKVSVFYWSASLHVYNSGERQEKGEKVTGWRGWHVLRWMDSARIELWLENGFGSGFGTDGNWLAFEPGIMLYAPHYVDVSESWSFAWRLKSLHLISHQKMLRWRTSEYSDNFCNESSLQCSMVFSSHMVAHLNPSSILQLDSTFHRLQAEAQSQNM